MSDHFTWHPAASRLRRSLLAITRATTAGVLLSALIYPTFAASQPTFKEDLQIRKTSDAGKLHAMLRALADKGDGGKLVRRLPGLSSGDGSCLSQRHRRGC